MTAIRDRQSDPDADEVAVRWDERPIIGDRRGLPWWGAVLLAFGLAVIGAIVDMQMQNTLAWVFKIGYFVGAVGAVCAVQRRSLFGPMVQPPLILAITVPGVVLLVSGLPANSDTLAKALAVGTPLINGFPTMAVTTGLTLIIGLVRLYRERDPNAAKAANGKKPADTNRPPNRARTREEAAARAGRPGREGTGRDATALRAGPAGRGRGPTEGRPQGSRGAVGDEHPSLPMTRRQRPDGEPSQRGGLRGRRGETTGRGGDRGARGGGDRTGRAEPAGGADPSGPAETGRRGGDGAGRGGDSTRGGNTPPGMRRFRQSRRASRDDIDPRRGDVDPRRGDARSGGTPGSDRPRRTPPRSGEPRGDDPRGDAQGDARRAPGRRGGPPPPRGRRPWDDEG